MPTRGRSSLFSNRYTSLVTILFIFPKRPLFCATGLALGVGQKCPAIRTHGTLCCKVTNISSPHRSLHIGQCNLINLVNILTPQIFSSDVLSISTKKCGELPSGGGDRRYMVLDGPVQVRPSLPNCLHKNKLHHMTSLMLSKLQSFLDRQSHQSKGLSYSCLLRKRHLKFPPRFCLAERNI